MLKRTLLVLCLVPWAIAVGGNLNGSIPDFTQTDVGPGAGQQFCAPTAVSNSLIWLMGGRGNQAQLVTLLASSSYMNTSLKNGTGTSGVLRGVHRYVNEHLGGYRTLSYQGWRKHPAKFGTGTRVPTIGFVERGVHRRSAAWINVGWYRRGETQREYRRVGGHWVTLVGIDTRKRQIIINDPAPRASNGQEYVTYRQLLGGRLVGKKQGLPTDAKGYLELGTGMHLHRKADTAIIDGVVLLEL